MPNPFRKTGQIKLVILCIFVSDDNIRGKLEVLVNGMQNNQIPATTFSHARPHELPEDEWLLHLRRKYNTK